MVVADVPKRVLILNTSAAYFGPKEDLKTGVWLEETAVPYLSFKEKGYTVDLASIKGGPIPLDPGSVSGDFFVEKAKAFLHDAAALDALSHSMSLADCAVLSYDCLYLSGGHGTCIDFYKNEAVINAVNAMISADKVVCADCHGPIGLIGCTKVDGTPLVAGLACTGFSDSEEGVVGQTANVPASIEGEFKKLGGKFETAADWNPKVCVAEVKPGTLVTGQNPQSSQACADAVIKLLG